MCQTVASQRMRTLHQLRHDVAAQVAGGRRGDDFEQLRLTDQEAGVHPVTPLCSRDGLLLKLRDPPGIVQHSHSAAAYVRTLQQEHAGRCSRLSVAVDHGCQLQVEQVVRIDDDERFVPEQGPCSQDPSGGAQQLRLARVCHAHAQARPVTNGVDDRFGVMMEVDHQLADPIRAEPVDVADQDLTAGHGDHAFRPVRRERGQASTEPCGEQHRLHV